MVNTIRAFIPLIWRIRLNGKGPIAIACGETTVDFFLTSTGDPQKRKLRTSLRLSTTIPNKSASKIVYR